jgi:hypothetical protein
MIRAILVSIVIIVVMLAGVAVAATGAGAAGPLEALRAVAVGVGLLVFVGGWMLAGLIDLARQIDASVDRVCKEIRQASPRDSEAD